MITFNTVRNVVSMLHITITLEGVHVCMGTDQLLEPKTCFLTHNERQYIMFELFAEGHIFTHIAREELNIAFQRINHELMHVMHYGVAKPIDHMKYCTLLTQLR